MPLMLVSDISRQKRTLYQIQQSIDLWEAGTNLSGGTLVVAKSWEYLINFSWDRVN